MRAHFSRPARVRARHVEWVLDRLSDRDRAIIRTVNRLRLVSSGQLERLHFADLKPTSRARNRRRVLARLSDWRVLAPLERRIGGVRAGSSGLVFALDSAGQCALRLAANANNEAEVVRRPGQPSATLVKHTLAVSELYVSLVELSRAGGFEMRAFDAEPRCWWPDGLGGWLKPDAFLLLANERYDDAWWLEQDMATAHLPAIARKLNAYLEFFNQGQRGPNGVMPRVLVSVPNEARKEAVQGVIRRLPDPAEKLLHATTSPQVPRYLLRVLRE
jgi:Replication-relaxation